MKGKAEQLLRECARRDLGKSRQPCSPCPPSQLHYAHAVPVDQCLLPAHAIEMMIKLVSEENRRGPLDAQIEARLPGDERIEAAYGRRVKRDGWRAGRIFRVNHRAAEACLGLALHYGYLAATGDHEWVAAPLLACALGETPSIQQCLLHQFASLRFRDSMELHIAA